MQCFDTAFPGEVPFLEVVVAQESISMLLLLLLLYSKPSKYQNGRHPPCLANALHMRLATSCLDLCGGERGVSLAVGKLDSRRSSSNSWGRSRMMRVTIALCGEGWGGGRVGGIDLVELRGVRPEVSQSLMGSVMDERPLTNKSTRELH